MHRASCLIAAVAALAIPTTSLSSVIAHAGTESDACPAGVAPQPAAAELTELRVATLPVVDFAPVYYAAACGFFAAQGLDVSLETVQGGLLGAQLLTSGDVDVTIVNWFGFAQAVSNGAPLAGIATSSVATPGTNYLFVSPDSGITSPEDLDGATLGVNTTSSVGDIFTTAALQQLDIDVEPEWVPTPLPETIAAIQSGALDGGHLAEPFATAARAAGLEPVFDLFEPYAGIPIGGYATLAETASEQPDMVEAFSTGVEGAAEMLGADGEALRAFVPTFAQVPPELLPEIGLPAFADDFAAADIQQTVDLMAGAGFLESPLDVAPYLVGAS